MEVICIEDAAYYKIIDKVMAYVADKHGIKEDKWISGTEAMKKLNITSKTTLQKFRDEGKIRYSQPEKRIILYDSDSITAFIEGNTYETF